MRATDAADVRRLQARLAAQLGAVGAAPTVIAYGAHGYRTVIAAGVASTQAHRVMFRTGCTTKLLVAALLERKLRVYGLHWESPLQSVLGAGSAAVAGVTIQHLLEHTHGIDDSLIAAAPAREDGRIDVERLLSLLAGRRRAEPGERYSYSNVGAFLIAAALERLEERPFAAQLHDDLLVPLGHGGRAAGSMASSAGAAPVCPATGGELRLAIGVFAAFLDACKVRPPLVAPGAAERPCSPPTSLPGWHPVERGVMLGWKAYAGGWFGHQSAWPGASLYLCVRPADGSSLVVASASHPALVVATKVLGRELPELLAPSLPRRAAAAAIRPSLHPYRGKYSLAADYLDIVAHAGTLILRGPRGATRLVAAGGELFWLERSEPGRVFVQFIDRGEDGRFSSLWDGRRVFPREYA